MNGPDDQDNVQKTTTPSHENDPASVPPVARLFWMDFKRHKRLY